MAYKGEYTHTIKPEDVGMMYIDIKTCEHCNNTKRFNLHGIGRIMDIDVGKQIIIQNGIPYMENQEQYKKRLAST